MKNIKKCKYCGDTENLYVYPSGMILNVCVQHYTQYKVDTLEKRKQTCLSKYGVDSANKVDYINEKRKQTCLSKYGVEYVINLKKIKDINKLRNIKILNDKCCKYCGTKENLHKFPNGKLSSYCDDCISKYNKLNYIKGKENNKLKKIHNKCCKYCGTKENLHTENNRTFPACESHFQQYKIDHILNIKKSYKNNKWDTFLLQLKNKYIIPLFNKNYYINNFSNFKYKCLKCNREFSLDITNTQKIWCSGHTYKSSYEYEIKDWLLSIDTNLTILHGDRTFGKEIDLHILEHNVGIDFHGLYWHSDLFSDKKEHQKLFNLFKEHNIQLIQIFENEWKLKTDIVKSIILSKLNINQIKVYARKTIIKEIDNKSYQLFLEQNHIQGYSQSKIKLGMFIDDRLISVLGLGKSRFKKNETEIIRYCSLLNHQIIGGLSKFLAHIKNNYNFDNIISYIDLRYFDGSSYLNNGFELESITKPNYYYFKNNGNDIYYLLNRIQFQKHKLKDKLKIFNPNLSEYENMLNNNYLRIFDAGNYKLRLNL